MNSNASTCAPCWRRSEATRAKPPPSSASTARRCTASSSHRKPTAKTPAANRCLGFFATTSVQLFEALDIDLVIGKARDDAQFTSDRPDEPAKGAYVHVGTFLDFRD